MKSLLLLLCAVATDASACGASITTASGTKAPSQICSGELIFNEEFDTFDFQTWNHEKTAAGGGVRTINTFDFKNLPKQTKFSSLCPNYYHFSTEIMNEIAVISVNASACQLVGRFSWNFVIKLSQ